MPEHAHGRVVLISGADGGIGSAITKELLEQGYRVSLGVLKPEGLADSLGPERTDRLYAKFDAFDKESASEWVSETVEKFGRIDGLINCAGWAERVNIYDDNDAAIDRLFEVNAKAPLRLTRLCLPHLEKTGQGRIINLASLAGKRIKNTAVGYAMSKYALMAVTHATRTVTWDKGVRATAICPGWVSTEMSLGGQGRRIATEDMTTPETLAHLIRTVLELPNNAAIAEVLVNCEFEDVF